MVHGNSVDHNEFKGSFWKLRNYFTVYAVDSRDHGQSSKVNGLHYSDMADDMVAFMDQLDLRDVVFFGHSDGAVVGLLAAMRTDRIGLLLAGSGNMSPEGVATWLRILNKAVYAATKNQKFLMMDTEPDISAEDLSDRCDRRKQRSHQKGRNAAYCRFYTRRETENPSGPWSHELYQFQERPRRSHHRRSRKIKTFFRCRYPHLFHLEEAEQKMIALLDHDVIRQGCLLLWQGIQMIDQISDKSLCGYGQFILISCNNTDPPHDHRFHGQHNGS